MLLSAAKEPITIWDVNIDTTVVSKLFKTKTKKHILNKSYKTISFDNV